jgi:hypothetical protein
MADSERITIEELSIRVKLEKRTMELFTIPLPPFQQEFSVGDRTLVRVLDNPLEDSLRDYVVWGRLKL